MRPTLVESGPAASAALRYADPMEPPFAVVILDAHLPREEIFAVALWLRQQRALATTPLIVLTAAIQVGERQYWQEHHGAVCITKPMAGSEFWEAIHQALVCAERGTAPSAAADIAGGANGQSLRVLLAEDNAIDERLTVRLLEKRGHT